MPLDDEKVKNENAEANEAEEVQADAAAKADAESGEGEVTDTELDNLKSEIDALNKKLADGVERMKRLQADFENFRRRTRQEKEELSAVVTQEFVKSLLPMLDNFERAMAAEAKDPEKFKQGMNMIHKQLLEVLKNKGMEVIDTKDAKFDPNFHQAVMRVENPDLEDDTIVMELQKGYMVKGKVVRPSMVQVVAN